MSHVSLGIDAWKRALEAKQKLPIQPFYSWSLAVNMLGKPNQHNTYIEKLAQYT